MSFRRTDRRVRGEVVKIEYVVSVKRIIDTAGRGEDPKPEEVVLAEFTGGADEASAVLASLAERVKSGKKLVGWASFVQAMADQIEKNNKEAKAKGEPSFGEMLGQLFKDPQPKR